MNPAYQHYTREECDIKIQVFWFLTSFRIGKNLPVDLA